MPLGEYKLARQLAGRGYYARVKVDVSAGEPAVVVGDDVFAWIRDAYGPNALYRDLDDFRGGARVGAEYALRNRTEPGPMQHVLVSEIHFTYVDTTRACVAFAACFAVWAALDDPGTSQPTLDQEWPAAQGA